MNKLDQLLAQRAAMDEAIAAEKNKGRVDALATVRALCRQYGITNREIKAYVLARRPRAETAKPAAKKPRATRKTAAKKTRAAKK